MCWNIYTKNEFKKKEQLIFKNNKLKTCYKVLKKNNFAYFKKNFKYNRGTLYINTDSLEIKYEKIFYSNELCNIITIGFHSCETIDELNSYMNNFYFKRNIKKFYIPEGCELSIKDDLNTQVSNQIIFPFSPIVQKIRKFFGLNPLYSKIVKN